MWAPVALRLSTVGEMLLRAAVVMGVVVASSTAVAQRSTPVQIVQSGGESLDSFGRACAVDGDTMVVTAITDNVGATIDQGTAHVYRWTGAGWVFEAALVASDGAQGDNFGWSVAISGDTIIVGAQYDDVGLNTNQGSAYVFVRSGTTWTQQAKLTSGDGAANDNFGGSLALSGDTAVVGAPRDDVGSNGDQGSAYVFVRSGTTWTQQAKLTSSDGAASDLLGFDVGLAGDTAIVGAHFDDVGATDQGSAYIFTRAGTAWTQQAKLTASDAAASDGFGISVAVGGVGGDTAIIGAYADDVAAADQGSAYVFVRSGTTWTQQAKLAASDGAASDNFGIAVAIGGAFGDTAIVGAYGDDVGANTNQGSAYVFSRSGAAWTQQVRLNATDGAASDNFGISVALAGGGDTAIVGAWLDDVGPNSDQGSAWVFSRAGSKWIGPDFMLLASDGTSDDRFGYPVAMSGDTAIIGAIGDDVGGNWDVGCAYVFTRSGMVWTQQAKLAAADGAANDHFGNAVAISGDTVVVGACEDDVGGFVDQGSAYVFTRSGTTWTQQAKLVGSDSTSMDAFGFRVALSGDTAIVGAMLDDVGSTMNQGSAYVFTRSGVAWSQQVRLYDVEGAADDQFGAAVAIVGNTAFVGSMFDDVGVNERQGSVSVFVRTGSSWSQRAKLTAADGAAWDYFGNAVAVAGDTLIVGAERDSSGQGDAFGSAYVFVSAGSAWVQQAKLTDSEGEAGDWFGGSVAISGDTAIVGSYLGGNLDQGKAVVFRRAGTAWTQLTGLIASNGAALDYFGLSVALAGDTVIVGAMYDSVGANGTQGSAWAYDIPANDFSFAINDTTREFSPTLSAAMLSALSGQQITGTEAAWRSIGTLNTLGRSLGLWSTGNLRTPSTSILDLGGSSILAAAPGNIIDLFGQLRTQGFTDLYADRFRLGSRGIMTARTGSSFTINAPVADLDGQTRLEQGSSLTFAGGVTAIGPTTANLNASLTTGGTFTNIDILSLTSATASIPLLDNRASFNVFGSTALFGNLLNNAGATTTIRSGTLFVFGSLTNNGTIVGTICAGCLSTPPSLDVSGDLSVGAASSLSMPFVDALVHVGGDVDLGVNSNTRYDMSLAMLQLEGIGGIGPEQTLEVMSKDIGPDAAGLDRTLAGHYPIKTLRIGPAVSTVRLVDDRDNDGLGQSSCEAIYADTLRIDAGSRLINASCKIYYNTLVNNGTIDVPANVIKIGGSCPADFNADGFLTFEDFDAFVGAFEAGSASADFNSDGFLTFEDFDAFVSAFEVGC